MIAALALLLANPPSQATQTSRADPPIRVTLNEDAYERGDRAKVKVRMADDGYLLVLRVDTDGHIRVLYPLTPGDQESVPGRRNFEVLGRDGRDAFTVSDAEGTGTVLAARSDQPFDFSEYARNGHWDYRALASDSTTSDREAVLVDLADRMSAGAYEYDVATYAVGPRAYSRYSAGWSHPWYYGSCFGCYDPFYGPRWSLGLSFRFGQPFYRRGRRW
jgi:uncharacterized protein DUF4384